MTISNESRQQCVDIAKGIAIVCIILGHLEIEIINRIVFTFHVPIFYLITGYYVSNKRSIKEFVQNKIRTLIVPYTISCFVMTVLSVLKNRITQRDNSDLAVAMRWIYASLYGAGDSYTEPFIIYQIGAIWFLLATFWASIILRFLLDRSHSIRVITVALWFVLCCISRRLFWFPFSIQASGPALLYMYFGYVMKGIIPSVKEWNTEGKTVFTLFAFWIWIEFVLNFKSFWLVHCDYGRGVIDIFGSICACCCIFQFSCWLNQHSRIIGRSLSFLGYYSLMLLCMHIIELNIFPWDSLIRVMMPEINTYLLLFLKIIGKLAWVIGMTAICIRINWIRRLFGYSNRLD